LLVGGYLAGVLGLQWAGGAFDNDFGGHPDEAAHYVTGLMCRDYLAAGLGQDPLEFAHNYYAYYPKVALGHWPPGFYLLQAVWMLIFPPSRTTILLLMALLAALLAYTLYRVVRTSYGQATGIIAGAVLITLPGFQACSGLVMTEHLSALLNLWAVICFGRFLDHGRWRDSLAFGLLAAASILTKATGLMLALVPLLAVLLAGRVRRLRQPAFWAPAAVVGVLCGPWYLLTLHMAQDGMAAPSLAFVAEAASYYAARLPRLVGVGLLLAAIAGIAVQARARPPAGSGGAWPTALAYLVSLLAFQVLVPGGIEVRYLVPAAPVLLMFAVAGAAWAAQRLTLIFRSQTRAAVAVAALLGLVYFLGTFTIPTEANRGFAAVARALLDDPTLVADPMLVSSDARGEGMFIAAVAEQSPQPPRSILRASQLLAASNWNGSTYAPVCNSDDQVLACLREAGVRVVVCDLSLPARQTRAHHRQLVTALDAVPEVWESAGVYPLTRHGRTVPDALRVYRLHNAGNPVAQSWSLALPARAAGPLAARAVPTEGTPGPGQRRSP
jgi:4-amino-4-deoxy-L-arabinose transferase-like glycosyltransferase